MADDLDKTGRPDRDRINVNEDYEVRAVGDRAEAVKRHLGR